MYNVYKKCYKDLSNFDLNIFSMPKISAGILPFRTRNDELQVFLVHPGGPFWAKKDLHSWSVTKGEIGENEELFAAAQREFYEETGLQPSGKFIDLDPVKQSGSKMIYSWAVEFDFDESKITSNFFSLEWPPKSGLSKEFPEIDKGAWFNIETAELKIVKGQVPVLKNLERLLSSGK